MAAGAASEGPLAAILAADKTSWMEALQHPFLKGCADASIEANQFNAWLAQDAQFAEEFTRLVAACLASAPREHFSTLFDGLAAMKDELTWFQEKAAERKVDLAVPLQPACQQYNRLMRDLQQRPYPVLITALWAIEYAYHEGWRSNGPMLPPYNEFEQRWGSVDFGQYVATLQQKAEAALQSAHQETQEEAANVCHQVAKLEVEFWEMAFRA